MSDHELTGILLEDLTPQQCEQTSKAVFNEITHAMRELRVARKNEVAKKKAHRRARRALILSEACPKVARGSFTVAHRDAWVEQQVEEEEFALLDAEATRESAQDYLRALREQGVLITSLNKSTQQAYGMSGVAA